ncbi:hypothetical protein G4O51_10520 [Candidatus Bathyarchaeota archaeon A05DMB-2]|jgi:hypothetical protein|nr:hypothetical protein [Candidatus Bathyarchaeota archaeon A05DMB-2]
MGNLKFHEKRHQISFRITEIAKDRLKQHAALFNMTPSEYAKAALYKDLGVFSEPLDRRRRHWKRKKRAEDDYTFEEEQPPEDYRGFRGSTRIH